MSAVIIFDSKYGHTAQYAHWLAEELEVSCYNIHELGALNLRSYDTLVFGGPIFMSRIKIAHLINLVAPKMQGKRLICFTVGMHPKDELYFDDILMKNFNPIALQSVTFFQLPGAVNERKLSLKDRTLLWGVKRFGRLVTNEHVTQALEKNNSGADLPTQNRTQLLQLLAEVRACERAASWQG